MSTAISSIKDYYSRSSSAPALRAVSNNKSAPLFRITPEQFVRFRHDIQMWRAAAVEAEYAYFPLRVKMQRMYLDTMHNEHLKACVRRRKNLTLLRKFKICNDAGIEDVNSTKIFKGVYGSKNKEASKPWFRNFQSYSLDSLLFGYNLISLGDVENDSFPNISFVKRQNISPDRFMVSSFAGLYSGESFNDPKYKDWYIYIPTPGETGSSPCGYGLLYDIAKTEILLRNNTGQNADYNETFGQPVRKGTTSKQDEERDEFENALKYMGSNAYILLDESSDNVELIESKGTGSAYETYKDFEKRGEAKISKIILGHADALDSVPGKLGAGSGEDNPVKEALLDTQSEDGAFMEAIINGELLPRMRTLGFNIPEDQHFEYSNDEEAEAFRSRQDKSNKVTAEIAKAMNDAGLQMSPSYFEERTGIPTTEKVITAPVLTDAAANGQRIGAIKQSLTKDIPVKK